MGTWSIKLRVPRAAATRATATARQRVSSAPDGVLALQGAIGNSAMQRLLQRAPDDFDVIKSLGSVTAEDWTPKRTGSVMPLYAEIATMAQATKLRDVKGTSEKDISTSMRAKEGEKDIKPGLNFVAKLGGNAAGECGFVDGAGVYHNPSLPVTLAGPLPKVAVILGPRAFERGKDFALGTMRHELLHAKHMQMFIDMLEKWRAKTTQGGTTKLTDDEARKSFDTWTKKQKSNPVERALIRGERQQNTDDTELLAYVEGIATVFHLGPQTPSLSLMAKGTGTYPAAIEWLRHAGKHFTGADKDVQSAALDRLAEYYKKVLDQQQKGAFRDWLQFLVDRATEKPQGTGQDAVVAKLVHTDFEPALGFLKKVLAIAPKPKP